MVCYYIYYNASVVFVFSGYLSGSKSSIENGHSRAVQDNIPWPRGSFASAGGDKKVTEFRRIDVTEHETSSKTVREIDCGNLCLIVAEINWKSKREFKPYDNNQGDTVNLPKGIYEEVDDQ
ncbi:hypothetical protein POM88_013395 [Heracleum sosnowskyi]|uniref:Uncharacterized protein n=1 Tax=Heracleum sosnowskyi TaxID=360622 RepID=A0AAD8N2N4_9APIA|nr:hypothetical protein POM88_013395 [Heracleum sosnowskyi]